jgi:hypothetical protein
VRHDAAPEKRVLERPLGFVNKLVRQNDVARPVLFLQRPDGADADDPGRAQLFHAENIGAMVQLAGQNAMAAAVAREKDHLAPGQFAGQEIVRRRPEGRFHLDPFWRVNPFDVIKPAAADQTNAMFRHAKTILTLGFSRRPRIMTAMSKRFYVTTAIDYANGAPHLGHAYEKVVADVIARARRALGEEVFFLTGLDEHGQKVQQAAQAEGKSPQDYCDAWPQAGGNSPPNSA